MNELEREDVLSQRRDEISRRQQQAQLAAMVRSQQAAAGKSRRKPKMSDAQRAKRRRASVRRELEDLDDPFAEDESDEDVFAESDDEPAAPTNKAAKLSELRRRRAERRRTGTAGDDGDDAESDAEPPRRRRRVDSDDDEYESESDYEDTHVPRRTRAESPVLAATSDTPPPLELLNALRLGRDQLERLLFLPNGRDLVRGCFVRCSWGMRSRPDGGKEHVYRVHQVNDVQQRDKYYDISSDKSGRWMNSYVAFEWSGRSHSVDLRPLSTQPFTDSERKRWIAALGADARYPSVSSMQAKQQQLEAALAAPLTEDDIKKMITRKRELRTAAEVSGATASASQMSAPLPTNHRIDEQTMAQINERNRRLDRERIQEAERRAMRAKREAASGKVPEAPPPDISSALAGAPSGTAVVPTIDVDLGDF
jgi:hypothetical protein